MDKVLEVKHLKVSFRTSGGILKAVRDISFGLERGKTLAVVGESGSGKSVTSKAILGILAGNAIVEGGEILYDGRDLLRIGEEELCRIRGDRISMIFQDPLSSLNPIVKIGKQITEAMLLKNKANRKAAGREFHAMLALLRKNVISAGGKVVKVSERTIGSLDGAGMLEFLEMAETGLRYSFQDALEKKKALVNELRETREYFKNGEYDRKSALGKCRKIAKKAEDSIDRLEIGKDSIVYTFPTKLIWAARKYFREEQKKTKNVYDFDDAGKEIVKLFDGMIARCESDIANAEQADFSARAAALTEYLKEKADQAMHTITPKTAKEKAIKLMEEAGIPEPRLRYEQYPFEFSGGMRQRIVIAIALAADPDILICDEPTTALDVTIQAQILELINRLKEERKLSVIFITHDLGVVANMADEIAVMYAGKIVEYGTADDIFYDPRHPYTWALLSSMPDLETTEKLDAIPGSPPNMVCPPKGDAFADRNKYAMRIDFEMQPPQFAVSDTHWAAAWLLHPDAPKVEVPKIITDRIERMRNAGGNA